MRRLLPVALLGFGAIAQMQIAAAQTPYDYPWCALRADRSGAQSCYFSSYGQCKASLRGIGGTCIRNPYQTQRPRERYRY